MVYCEGIQKRIRAMKRHPLSSHRSLLPRRPWMVLGFVTLMLGTAAIVHVWPDASAEQSAMPQAMPVQVMTLQAKPMRVSSDYSGKLTAVDFVEVRPRVGGTITKVFFEEGAIVTEGDPLFEIDLRPYRAAASQAQAALNKAYSEAAFAREELNRAKKLVEAGHTSKSVYDQRASSQKVADASIRAAQAQLTQANLNLEYATITAPITGRIGRAEKTVGNLVEVGGAAPLLTTIVSHDKIYAEFDVDEQTYLSAIRQSRVSNEALDVTLHLAGDDKRYAGKMHSFDNQINPESGTIRARALLANDDGALMPGMFATVSLSLPEKTVVSVPESAIGTDQNKRFVYVVGEGNKVVYREVKLGASSKGQRIVTNGVSEGEQLILSGLQMLHPDMPVTPMKEGEAPPAATSQAAP